MLPPISNTGNAPASSSAKEDIFRKPENCWTKEAEERAEKLPQCLKDLFPKRIPPDQALARFRCKPRSFEDHMKQVMEQAFKK